MLQANFRSGIGLENPFRANGSIKGSGYRCLGLRHLDRHSRPFGGPSLCDSRAPDIRVLENVRFFPQEAWRMAKCIFNLEPGNIVWS